jgi:hypothetical protein
MVAVFAGVFMLDAKMNADFRTGAVESDHNWQQEGRR